MRFVALKSEEQQAVLSLHRMRAQLVKIRTMQSYQVRSPLTSSALSRQRGFRALADKAAPLPCHHMAIVLFGLETTITALPPLESR